MFVMSKWMINCLNCGASMPTPPRKRDEEHCRHCVINNLKQVPPLLGPAHCSGRRVEDVKVQWVILPWTLWWHPSVLWYSAKRNGKWATHHIMGLVETAHWQIVHHPCEEHQEVVLFLLEILLPLLMVTQFYLPMTIKQPAHECSCQDSRSIDCGGSMC